jgi:pimeloyl-ACP methyl ester carboxylesterase
LRIAGVKNDDRQITQLTQYPVEDISVPVLVVHSPTDPLVSIDQAKWMADSVQNGQLIELKNGGHICFAARKELIRSPVAGFFA